MNVIARIILVAVLFVMLLPGCGGNSASIATRHTGVQSTNAKLSGPLDISQTPKTLKTAVYDALGNAHTLQIAFTNPVDPVTAGAAGTGSVPAGATQKWTLNVSLDGTAVSPSPTLYAVGGQFIFTDAEGSNIGSKLQLNGVGSSGAPNFPLSVDFGNLSDASNVTATADGQSTPTKIASTLMTLNGNLNEDGGAITSTTTVYTSAGVAQTLTTTLTPSSPLGTPGTPPTPTGATAAYDVQIVNTTMGTTLYDSTVGANNESKAYYVPGQGLVLSQQSSGNILGSAISLNGASGDNQGQKVVTGMTLSISLSKLVTTVIVCSADGQGSQ
jgi:hypothetical protein